MKKPIDIFKGLSSEQATRLRFMANEALKTKEYSPFSSSNFWEAITEADEDKLTAAHALLAKGEYVAAAAAMNLISHSYWLEHCLRLYRDVAIEQLAQERFDREQAFA